jgi:phosphoglycerate dehydrogenase-like enzyme
VVPPDGPVPPFAAINAADRLLDCVADVDSVIISATQQAGQPPLVDDTVLRAMRPGAWLVNIARYLDHQPPSGLLLHRG